MRFKIYLSARAIFNFSSNFACNAADASPNSPTIIDLSIVASLSILKTESFLSPVWINSGSFEDKNSSVASNFLPPKTEVINASITSAFCPPESELLSPDVIYFALDW